MNDNNYPLQFQNRRRNYLLWLIPLIPALYIDFRFMFKQHGLPIDDAYIYVEYIQNIVAGSGYSFNPGEVSFGVTSFLFTIVGAALHFFLPFMDTIYVVQILSVLSHMALLWLTQAIVYDRTQNDVISVMAGLLLAFCYPIYFTGPSGMETLFFIAMGLLVYWLGSKESRLKPAWLGVLCATFYLSRPEGLFFMMGFMLFLGLYPFVFPQVRLRNYMIRLRRFVTHYMIGFMAFTLPYLIFVKLNSGHWMPTTFYGKMLNQNKFLLTPWYRKIREGFLALTEGYTQIIEIDNMPFTVVAMVFLSMVSIILFAHHCGKYRWRPQPFAIRGAFYLFFFLPFIYGAVFHAAPMFGGYYVRYILILMVLLHIESHTALHHILTALFGWIHDKNKRLYAVRISSFLVLPVVLFSVYCSIDQWKSTLRFYAQHVTTNETVRKQTGIWLKENTPTDARIMTFNTGLGAIGTYSNRFTRDEAGLVHPDIHPYLKGFSEGYQHWYMMLEYMKDLNLDYFTIFPPYGEEETRYTNILKEIEQPSFLGTDFKKVSRVHIARFTAPEHYDLASDHEQYATLKSRNPELEDCNPNPAELKNLQQRITLMQSMDKQSIAIRLSTHSLEIRHRILFPTVPKFMAFVQVKPDETLPENMTITLTVKVNDFKQLHTNFSKTYTVAELSTPQAIEVYLSAFSGRYADIFYGAQIADDSPIGLNREPELIWINPVLTSQQ